MANTKKTWRGRALYERLLEERERDGATMAELSRRSGVPKSTLQRWSRRLCRERSASGAPFLELVPTPRSSSPDRIEVLLRSGRSLVLPARGPFDGLAELIALLESC